ncbi:MAG: hypothetical protein AVDCRST_MAG85-3825 [uncultured Solirubrobacteraceae bacterium]|uniref:Uncharacterized protein n=1 Tax=uncultured Solirubrobacteraceae bacterium TaxID=1162706 RepID=A0A6J4TUU6_9ACTN|nr:MAG: hypothetical protein AVDCRST_MAG85-3825 [uncultured Solirubrobacteraceae bacterium]
MLAGRTTQYEPTNGRVTLETFLLLAATRVPFVLTSA